jgi:choline dehydrogenase
LSGWGYADVLPYFKRAEQHLHGADAYHGASGPLAVFAPDLTSSPLAAAFVQAAGQAGYGLSPDPNGERQEGFGRVDRTTRNGRRCIEARIELPAVGANLNDHPDLVIQHRCLQPVSIFSANRGMGKIWAGIRWFAGLGGLAGSNHFEAGGFLRSRAGVAQPDLQLTFMPLAIKPGTVEDVGMHSFQVHIDLMRPQSLGRVTVRSADPAAAPSICFNYLAERQDREDLRTAVRLTRFWRNRP